jgi:hypothetical protein
MAYIGAVLEIRNHHHAHGGWARTLRDGRGEARGHIDPKAQQNHKRRQQPNSG